MRPDLAPDEVLLVVPGGLADGPATRRGAEARGTRVVGASSVVNDPAAREYAEWAFLPHVADPRFGSQLLELIDKHGVSRVHATHYMVWRKAKDVLAEAKLDVALDCGRTYFDVEREHRDLVARVAAYQPPEALKALRPIHGALSGAELAGFLRAALTIPGESDEAKLLAMLHLAPHAPRGDVVEVGSLFGRTAALLAMIARRYDLGSVLCVDPWSNAANDQAAAELHEASLAYNWAEWRKIFEVNVAPFALGRLNYLQMAGEEAGRIYSPNQTVHSEAFGSTEYSGRIGLLHIDGNHAYEHVLADCRAWTPHVVSGGWIIFDDYEWPWGDGPRRVADAFVAENAVGASFLVSGALFVQMG